MDEIPSMWQKVLVITSLLLSLLLCYTGGVHGWGYLLYVPLSAVPIGFMLYIIGWILVGGFALSKASMVKKNTAIRYTFLLGLAFLIIELWRGQTIAAYFSPHHFYAGRDMLVRTVTEYDDNGNPYQIPVAWYNQYHELHVYYINDQKPSIWYKDLNNKWHKANDMDAGNVHLIMFGVEIAILVIVYRRLKVREKKLHHIEQVVSN